MKINKLIDLLSHIGYDEKEIMRGIFGIFTSIYRFRINSIFYINNDVVKFFCTGEEGCKYNIVIIGNEAYYWEGYRIKRDSIILDVPSGREYTISEDIQRLLDKLQETPIASTNPRCLYVKLYDKLRQGYKIEINIIEY